MLVDQLQEAFGGDAEVLGVVVEVGEEVGATQSALEVREVVVDAGAHVLLALVALRELHDDATDGLRELEELAALRRVRADVGDVDGVQDVEGHVVGVLAVVHPDRLSDQVCGGLGHGFLRGCRVFERRLEWRLDEKPFLA